MSAIALMFARCRVAPRPSLRALVAVFFVVALAGCQSTSIRSAWFDTDFAGPPMRKVVVFADLGTTAQNRVFEDAFVAQLRATGVEAIAGHATLGLDEATPDNRFAAAVTGTQAQGLLLVRLLGVDTRTQVRTTMAPGGMGWGRDPWGRDPWGRPRAPAQRVTVTQSDFANVEAKLFEVESRALVWAATTSTFNPRSVERETAGFADVILAELLARGVIARR